MAAVGAPGKIKPPPRNQVAARTMSGGPRFSAEFRQQLQELLRWRRDVRSFRSEPLPPGLLEEILNFTQFAPSVGLSEPWRFVRISSPELRRQVKQDFEHANAQALADYSGARAALYARLKLEGLESAPVHLAVFADRSTGKGSRLGCQTMPEMLDYSAVAAVITLWLAARAYGVGVGWVSILHPERINRILSIPDEWRLVAYLCIGYPETESAAPELERAGWEMRLPELILLES